MSLYAVLGICAILVLLGGAVALVLAVLPSLAAAWAQLVRGRRAPDGRDGTGRGT